jgi:HD-GYP domain-containing protein (c-di-GMP phosphodiesterase class II)
MDAKRIKVPVSDLSIGMYVTELDRPWLDTPFLTQGFPILSDDDICAVQKACDFVFVDAERSKTRPQSAELPGTAKKHRPASTKAGAAKPRPSLMSKLFTSKRNTGTRAEVSCSIVQAKPAFEETRQLVRNVFDEVRLGRSIDTPQAKEVVSQCVDQVVENPDAMLLLTNIKNKDSYTAEHSLNVSILSIVLGKALGLKRERLEVLGTCGLLHDVGKIMSPDEVLKKEGRLTPEEFLIMKMHPTQGRDILMSSDQVIGPSIDVAHGHHERLDGSGYPRGLAEDSLTLFTRIVSVVDVYDAITSNRVYDSSRTSIEAFKILQAQGGNHFDSELVSRLIETIGIYPPGSVVQIASGEIGVVVRNNTTRKLLPKILVLKDSKLKPITPRYIDLADPGHQGKLRITKQLSAREAGIDLHAFRNAEFLGSVAAG